MSTPTNPVRLRARLAANRAEKLGVSKAELARRIGRAGNESQMVYVRMVLNGGTTSEPVTSAVEAELDAIAAERSSAERASAEASV